MALGFGGFTNAGKADTPQFASAAAREGQLEAEAQARVNALRQDQIMTGIKGAGIAGEMGAFDAAPVYDSAATANEAAQAGGWADAGAMDAAATSLGPTAAAPTAAAPTAGGGAGGAGAGGAVWSNPVSAALALAVLDETENDGRIREDLVDANLDGLGALYGKGWLWK